MKHLMKLLALLFFVSGLSDSLQAQLYTEYFLQEAEGYHSMTPTATTGAGNGSVLVTGYYDKKKEEESHFATIPFICKFNGAGVLEWFYDYNHLGDSYPELQLKPVAITVTQPEENIIIAGHVYDENNNFQEPFVIKVNHYGEHEFTKFYNCIEDREDPFLVSCTSFQITELISDTQNGVVLGGYARLGEEGEPFGILIQLDEYGVVVPGMIKTFTNPDYRNSEVVSVRRMESDEYIVLLSATMPVTATSWNVRPNIVKLNNQFQTLWAKTLYRNEYYDSYTPHGLEITSNQLIMVSGALGHKLHLSKLTDYGYEIWTQSYIYTDMASDTSWIIYPHKLAIDYLDNLYLAKNSLHRATEKNVTRVLSVNSDGNIIWSRRYGSEEEDNYIKDMCLLDNSPYTFPAQDVVLVGERLYDENDQRKHSPWKVRARILDGSMDCNYAAIDVEQELVSYHADDYEPGLMNIIPTQSYEELERHDPGTTLEKCNNSFFTEAEQQTVIPEPAGKIQEGHLWVFPNPNQGDFQLRIASSQSSLPAVVRIYDIAGRLQRVINVEGRQTQVQVAGLAKGSYLIRWTQGESTNVQKVIVQ